MAELGVLIFLVGIAVCVWLSVSALNQIKQLRTELDETQRQLNETQRQLNETQRQLNELKAAAEVVPAPPPPLPRARSSGGLDDLREQLRASHREEPSAEE